MNKSPHLRQHSVETQICLCCYVVDVAAASLVVADVVVAVVVETVNLVPSALNITKSELLGNILWAIRLMHIDISTRLRQGFLQKIRRH